MFDWIPVLNNNQYRSICEWGYHPEQWRQIEVGVYEIAPHVYVKTKRQGEELDLRNTIEYHVWAPSDEIAAIVTSRAPLDVDVMRSIIEPPAVLYEPATDSTFISVRSAFEKDASTEIRYRPTCWVPEMEPKIVTILEAGNGREFYFPIFDQNTIGQLRAVTIYSVIERVGL